MMSPSAAWLHSTSPRSTSFGVSRGSGLRHSARLGASKSLPWLHSPGHPSRSSAATLPEHANTDALVALSTLQQTARGWLASYDGRLSQNFWSKQAGSAVRGSLEGERLPPVASNTAKRENFKKEHYASELDRITAEAEEGRPKPHHHHSKECLRARALSLEALEKEVKTGCHLHEIEELIKGAANQHRHFRPHQKLEHEDQQEHAKRAELERLHRAAETAKRVRRQTDLPRNPRWRVDERLKRERALWKDTGEPPKSTQNLPMTQFSVQGERGLEEHSLVDVRAIQAKCRGLSQNCSAKSLLDAQRSRDQEQRAAMAKKAADAGNACSKDDLAALAALSWEDRAELAQRRKLQGYISSVFDKMGAMRSKYPKEVPDSIVNHLHAMHAGDFNWHEEC